MNDMRLWFRLLSSCALVLLLGAPTGLQTLETLASPGRIVEDDNYGQYYLWVTDVPNCPQFAPDPYPAGLVESVVKSTLPMEWEPSWPETALKAGAVLVRTVAWESWFNPEMVGQYNFRARTLARIQIFGASTPIAARRV